MAEMAGTEEKEWDFECPKYVDFTSEEIWAENHTQNDAYFADLPVGHPLTPGKSEATSTATAEPQQAFVTPPSAMEKEKENDVFYSAKRETFTVDEARKSLSSKYWLRETPLRGLHFNGLTPLREPRTSHTASSKRKARKAVSDYLSEGGTSDVNEELVTEVVEETIIETAEEATPGAVQEVEEEVVHDMSLLDLYSSPRKQKVTFEGPVVVPSAAKVVATPVAPSAVPSATLPVARSSRPSSRPSSRASRGPLSVSKKTEKVPQKAKPKTTISSILKKKLNQLVPAGPLRASPRKKKTAVKGLVTTPGNRPSRSTTRGSEAYKSMAELVKEFETTKRGYGKDSIATEARARSRSCSLTRPVTPKLQAISRNRPRALTSDEIIVQEMKKYTFKATPYNKSRLANGFVTGIPKVTTIKKPTKPVGFNFKSDQRLEVRKGLFPVNTAAKPVGPLKGIQPKASTSKVLPVKVPLRASVKAPLKSNLK